MATSLPPRHPTACTAGGSFGVGTLLLICGLVGTCLAVARLDPLAAILAAAVSAAALHRTQRVVQILLAAGAAPGNGLKLLVFLKSVGLALIALAAVAGVAGLVGLAGWLSGQALVRVFAEPWIPAASMAWGLVTGLPAGMIAGERFTAAWWNPARV